MVGWMVLQWAGTMAGQRVELMVALMVVPWAVQKVASRAVQMAD